MQVELLAGELEQLPRPGLGKNLDRRLFAGKLPVGICREGGLYST